MKYKLTILASSALFVSGFAATSVAQEQPDSDGEARSLETIVVTSRLREETPDDIGQTINLLSAADLAANNVLTYDDIVRVTPGLDNISRGPGRNTPLVRGVGQMNAGSDLLSQTNTVTQFFDEVPVSTLQGSQTELPLFDLSRVEVLKGPQPTYFGEGSVGGSVRFFSQDPSLDGFEARTRAEISSVRDGDMSYIVDGSASFPIIEDKLGLRLTGFYDDRGGFIDNLADGQEDVNDFENSGFTGVLLFEPTENFTWRLSGFYQSQDLGSEQAATGDPDDLESAVPGPDDRTDDSFLIANKFSWDVGPVTFESVTGYFEREVDRAFFDSSQSFVLQTIFFLPGAEAFTTTLNEDKNFTQDFRVITNFDSPLNFVGGLYYSDTESKAFSTSTSDAFVPIVGDDFYFGANFLVEGEQISAFGELQLSLMEDRLRLAAGARYFDQEFIVPTANQGAIQFPFDLFGLGLPPTFLQVDESFFGGAAELEASVDDVLPRFQAEFDLNENVLLHGSVAKGTRNGFYNSPGVLALNALPFESFGLYGEDSATSYEIGFKSTILGGDAQLNASAFFTDYEDIQVAVSINGVGLTQNVGEARIQGLEGTFDWAINEYVSFFSSASFIDAEFEDPVPLSFDPLGNPLVFSPDGAAMPQIPEVSYSLGLEGRKPVGFFGGSDIVGRATYNYTDERTNNLTFLVPGGLELESLGLLNLQLGLEKDTWSIHGYVANVTDEVERTFDQSLLGIESFVNRPRTVGIVLRNTF